MNMDEAEDEAAEEVEEEEAEEEEEDNEEDDEEDKEAEEEKFCVAVEEDIVVVEISFFVISARDGSASCMIWSHLFLTC